MSAQAISQLQECSVCHAVKPLEAFQDHTDGSGKKTICRTCEVRKLAEDKARGIRRCTTCGRRTINYRCAQCWVRLNGFYPVKSTIALSNPDGTSL